MNTIIEFAVPHQKKTISQYSNCQQYNQNKTCSRYKLALNVNRDSTSHGRINWAYYKSYNIYQQLLQTNITPFKGK